ncbi:MAG: cytochrome b/b6 domain-containing protein [Woeseiaceae bacterium]|nr:cytochrome b/b6 domain-containing protein [Woeseiaceae bacterium]
MTRYHPSLVALHWLMALLIAVLLSSGGLAPTRMHVVGGAIAAGLLALRIVVRLAMTRHLPTSVDRKWRKRAAKCVHVGLYVLVGGAVVSGIGVAIEADLLAAYIDNRAVHGFSEGALYALHVALTDLLLIAILGHLAAAFWHQFIRKDRILSKIWFGKPESE